MASLGLPSSAAFVPRTCKWVVGIDVGTSGTAFAYAPIPVPGAPPLHPGMVHVFGPGSVHGGLIEGSKGATAVCVAAAPGNALEGIGDRALRRFHDARQREVADEHVFFIEFKMQLQPGADTDGTPEGYRAIATGGPRDARGRRPEYQLLLPMRRLLEGVKDAVMERLTGSGGIGGEGLREDEIAWALTVPAIWDEEGKAFMRRAAELAGLIRTDGSDAERLSLVLEPEAAAVASIPFIQRLPAGACPPLEPGRTKILIMDCGGGTLDMTSSMVRSIRGHSVQLDELQAPGGGPWGGTAVDRELRKFLSHLVLGRTGAAASQPIGFGRWLDLREEWASIKHAFDMVPPGSAGAAAGGAGDAAEAPVTLNITELVRTAMPDPDADLKAWASSEFLPAAQERLRAAAGVYGDVRLELIGRSTVSVCLRLPKQAIAAFFEPSLAQIAAAARRMLAHPGAKGTSIVLVVGGYAQSKYLLRRLVAELQAEPNAELPHGRRVIRPDGAWSAVTQGAVLFALSPDGFVTERVVRSNFGIVCSTRHGVHEYVAHAHAVGKPGFYRYFERNGHTYVADLVEEALASGSRVRSDHVIERHYWAYSEDRVPEIEVVRTPLDLAPEPCSGRFRKLIKDHEAALDRENIPQGHIAARVRLAMPHWFDRHLLAGWTKGMLVRFFFGRSEITAEVTLEGCALPPYRARLTYTTPRRAFPVPAVERDDDDDGAAADNDDGDPSGHGADPAPVRAHAGAARAPRSAAGGSAGGGVGVGSRAVCRYWLRGNCRFGGRCRDLHEHPRGAVSGGGDAGSAGGGGGSGTSRGGGGIGRNPHPGDRKHGR